MYKERVLPIEYIDKGSKVVIYGAGNNGRSFYQQNLNLQWCEVVSVVDTNYMDHSDFPIKVDCPERIKNIRDWDYILVSVSAEKPKSEIVKWLMDNGVSRKQIIDDIDCFVVKEEKARPLYDIEFNNAKDKKTQIGFLPGGVMGDNVISLRLYKALYELAPESDIYVFSTFEVFPEIIFEGQKNLVEIIHRMPNDEDKKNFDVIIQSHFEPSLLYFNVSQTSYKNEKLAKAMELLYNYQERDWFMCSPAQYMNRLQWDRAKFKGWSCYTILGSSGAFVVDDDNIDFYLNSKYEKQYCDLNLPAQYISFNYGASDPLKNGKPQTKMWPYEYHVKLISIIKKEYPRLPVVQIGDSNVRIVDGADHYIIGEHLEISKYVLAKSALHIDCEGGLVHIASQLGTKCAVVFGPTPVGFFGYKNNINIVSEKCKECCGLIKEWYTRCYKYDRPECMYSITPERVLHEIADDLEKITSKIEN